MAPPVHVLPVTAVLTWTLLACKCRKVYYFEADQGHIYPLGEYLGQTLSSLHWESNPGPLRHRRALYLNSYLDAAYSEPQRLHCCLFFFFSSRDRLGRRPLRHHRPGRTVGPLRQRRHRPGGAAQRPPYLLQPALGPGPAPGRRPPGFRRLPRGKVLPDAALRLGARPALGRSGWLASRSFRHRRAVVGAPWMRHCGIKVETDLYFLLVTWCGESISPGRRAADTARHR
jgi:hypothetical protein